MKYCSTFQSSIGGDGSTDWGTWQSTKFNHQMWIITFSTFGKHRLLKIENHYSSSGPGSCSWGEVLQTEEKTCGRTNFSASPNVFRKSNSYLCDNSHQVFPVQKLLVLTFPCPILVVTPKVADSDCRQICSKGNFERNLSNLSQREVFFNNDSKILNQKINWCKKLKGI